VELDGVVVALALADGRAKPERDIARRGARFRLADEFGLRVTPRDQKQYAVVLGIGDARVALLVDRLEGQQDAVIKPVQGPLRTLRGVAGATELGAQNAVLVLDVSALVADAGRRREVRT
jgi:chemotaxis protein histidine kinase CheA